MVSFIHAQINTEFELDTQSGYEYNIFKAPSSFVDPESGELLGEEDLYTSSFYQRVGAKALFTKEMKANQNLSLRLRPVGRFYLSESEASYFTIYSRLRYEKEFNSKTSLRIQTHYNYRDRDGENFDDNELRTPLGYRQADISAGLFFRLYNQNRSFIEIEYGNRNFKDGETNDLYYNYYRINTIFRNVFKRAAGYHSYGIEASFMNRFFTRSFVEDEPNTNRNWSYITLEPFYRIPLTEKWRVRPALEWSKRIDNDQGTFTYSQIKPSLEVRYKTDKWLVETTASLTNRKYSQLRATNSGGEDLGNLELKYYRLRVNAERKISKSLSITSEVYVNNRVSNRTDVASSFFRSYDYFYAGIGLRYTF